MVDSSPVDAAGTQRARVRAALVHLGASVTLGVVLAYVVFVLWFPGAFLQMCGGAELFRLVLAVDVILGPMVTTVVFNPRKPRAELARDMTVVVTLQLAALGYGLHAVSLSRPVAVALELDRFRIVSAVDVRSEELPSAPPAFRHLSWRGPIVVSTSPGEGTAQRNEDLDLALRGFDLGTRPTRWHPWDAEARRQALARARPLDTLVRGREALEVQASALQRQAGGSALACLPAITFRGDWVVVLRADTGNIVGYLQTGF
jgi:hypothetical protein